MKLNSIPSSVSADHSNLEELHATLLSRATSLSETALKVLLCKRDKLTLEQRSIEDEIAKCDERIKNIQDDVELQLETILESCNEAYLQESHDKSACKSREEAKSDAEEARESAAACLPTKLYQNTATADVDLTAKMYTALRRLRSDLLKKCHDGVTAYHIFSNPMLQKISKKIPRNKEELLEIDGLGKAKVSRYGDRLLETIESTINEYNLNKKCSMELKYGHGEV